MAVKSRIGVHLSGEQAYVLGRAAVGGTTKKTLVGHGGAVLLRRCADRTGLATALATAFAPGNTPAWWDRGLVLVSTAVVIALGGTCMSDVELLLAHHATLFGSPPSDSTVRRGLDLDQAVLAGIAKVRARVRAHVWDLLAQCPGGFPWVGVAGKVLTGWVVIDADATLITAHSAKEGAAPTFKKGFGFHPLGAWCANTTESLAMLLSKGNAGSNTVADHVQVLGAAIAQVPAASRRKILIRVDGAGATHDLVTYMHGLNTTRRTVRFTEGWAITEADEDAIALLPEDVWVPSLTPDGQIDKNAQIAELTGLDRRGDAWLPGLRLLANIAADLDAWTRLLGLHDEPDLVHAEPETLRYRLWHVPATLARHARRRTLAIAETWPWATAFTTCWQRLSALPLPV